MLKLLSFQKGAEFTSISTVLSKLRNIREFNFLKKILMKYILTKNLLVQVIA